jgi:hypothetical protein
MFVAFPAIISVLVLEDLLAMFSILHFYILIIVGPDFTFNLLELK